MGLYGLLSRQALPADAVRERLAWMRSRMMVRPAHRFVEHAVEAYGIGFTGTGLFEGSLTVQCGPSGRAMLADGEVYHVETPDGRACRGQAAWRAVYDRWVKEGPGAIASVDGLYNTVEINPGLRSLTIVSDRWGSRRLYYMDLPDAFVFASELKPLVAWLGGRATVDRRFVEESVCFGSAFGHRTWIREVSLFPPATVMTVTSETSTSRRSWQWSDVPPPDTHTAPDRFDALHGLWQRAISARLDGARVGQQLSGGLDSRLILGEAVRQRTDWFAATYGEAHSDDARFARRAAQAVRVPWLLWPLPGANWLDRRLALSLEHDGIVDLTNAHHAGLVEVLGGLIDFEMSGYLGDVVMGGTGYDVTADAVLGEIPYWESPVSLGLEQAQVRVLESARGSPTPWAWMMENKRRRATNAWPHMAVSHLEVRKPFMDYALVDYCAGLPAVDRRTRRPQRELLARFYPTLARLPWQKTGVRPTAGPLGRHAMKGVRLAYRRLQPIATRMGFRMEPWVRNAADVDAWCAAPEIRRAIVDTVTSRTAALADYFDRAAIERTTTLAFDRREVAIEVPMNLYRVEHMLERLRHWRTAGAGPE